MTLLSALTVCGCIGKSSAPLDRTLASKEEATVAERPVSLSAGTADIFGEAPKRELLWTLRWDSGQLDATETKTQDKTKDAEPTRKWDLDGGQLTGVSGQVYAEGGVASVFSSKEGQGDKAKGRLVLRNSVRVESKAQGAVLTCDELEYFSKTKLYHARGHVQVEGKMGTLGAIEDLLATSDLKRVGTPDLFRTAGEN